MKTKKKTSKVLFLLCIVSFLLVVLAACSPAENGSANPPDGGIASNEAPNPDMEYTSWSMMTKLSSGSWQYEFYDEFIDAVYERTDGLLDITLYAAGELPVSDSEMVTATSQGIIQIGDTGSYACSGISSVVEMFQASGVITSTDDMAAVLADQEIQGLIAQELGAINVGIKGFTSQWGLAVFGVGNTPQSVEDLQGLTLRVSDAMLMDMFTQLGMMPTTISWDEIITSLQRNVIDAAFTGVVSAYNAGWADVVQWAYYFDVSPSCNLWFVNTQAFGALPVEIQAILEEEFAKLQEKCIDYNQENLENFLVQFETDGVDVVYASEAEYSHVEEISIAINQDIAAAKGESAVACLNRMMEILNK